MYDTETKLRDVITVLDDKQGRNVFVYNVTESSGYTDYFVVVSGRSVTHTQTLADSVARAMKQKSDGSPAVEGREKSRWILVDSGDVVVHAMLDDVRHYYDIDGLFGEDQRVDIAQYR